MLRGRGLLLLVVSVALAGLAAVVAQRWMSAREAALEASKPGVVNVAVAALEIPLGTKVEARHVGMIQMLSGSQPPDAFIDTTELVGKVAKSTILPGELLIKARFVDPGAGSTLAAVISPEMRAVSIRVDDVVGVGGFLLPGNRVDIILSYNANGRVSAETILTYIKVLAVDQYASTEENQPVVVRAVTLEVTPEGAEAISAAREMGRLQLTLRNPTDTTEVVQKKPEPAPKPVAVRRAPAPPPPPQPTLQVIRGTAVQSRPTNQQ